MWLESPKSTVHFVLCHTKLPQIGFRTKSARFIKKALELEIAGEWRACVFGDFSHLFNCSMMELSTRREKMRTQKSDGECDGRRVRVYHELRHIVFEAGEHKKWFNIWNAESENVYFDINSKKEGKVWRETWFSLPKHISSLSKPGWYTSIIWLQVPTAPEKNAFVWL